MESNIEIGHIYQKDFQVTSEKILQFANVLSDFNPVHFDVEFAKGTRYKKPIAHGILSASFISSVLGNDFPGMGTIYISQSLNFTAPVFAGDTITVSVKLVQDLGKSKYSLETICENQNKVIVINGMATVLNKNIIILPIPNE